MYGQIVYTRINVKQKRIIVEIHYISFIQNISRDKDLRFTKR